MIAGDEQEVVRRLLAATGLKLSDQEAAIVTELHATYAAQRARLSGAARPETEPMTIPAFDRATLETEASDEPAGR